MCVGGKTIITELTAVVILKYESIFCLRAFQEDRAFNLADLTSNSRFPKWQVHPLNIAPLATVDP